MSVACAKIAVVVFAVKDAVVIALVPATPVTEVEIELVQAALE
jgi:hypothetical protein